MAVRIRLSRTGKRHQPSYRIVVTDSQRKRDGKTIETLGWYNPVKAKASIKIDQNRLNDWLAKGARMSDRVNFLVSGEKRLRTKVKKKEKSDEGSA